jgi:uncharacterized protein (TIGR02453 family)
VSEFRGFSEETVRFFSGLSKNNNRRWFEAHRADFEKYVLEPGRAFTQDMGERLTAVAPGIIAEPRVDGSIFRIYRDTRFSKDKTPFKTHLGIFMWEGGGPKMECPGFYFHLEPPKLLLGGGIHIFSRPLLEEYRRSVVHPVHGPDLDEAVASVSKQLGIGGKHYKRTPRGYDPGHPLADFLLFNGLTAWIEGPVPQAVFSAALVDHCFNVFKGMVPLHRWLLKMAARSHAARR